MFAFTVVSICAIILTTKAFPIEDDSCFAPKLLQDLSPNNGDYCESPGRYEREISRYQPQQSNSEEIEANLRMPESSNEESAFNGLGYHNNNFFEPPNDLKYPKYKSYGHKYMKSKYPYKNYYKGYYGEKKWHKDVKPEYLEDIEEEIIDKPGDVEEVVVERVIEDPCIQKYEQEETEDQDKEVTEDLRTTEDTTTDDSTQEDSSTTSDVKEGISTLV